MRKLGNDRMLNRLGSSEVTLVLASRMRKDRSVVCVSTWAESVAGIRSLVYWWITNEERLEDRRIKRMTTPREHSETSMCVKWANAAAGIADESLSRENDPVTLRLRTVGSSILMHVVIVDEVRLVVLFKASSRSAGNSLNTSQVPRTEGIERDEI